MRQFLLELVEENPIDVSITHEVCGSVSQRATGAWMARQEAAGTLKLVGLAKDANGSRRVRVFCNGWNPKEDNLNHELIGTRIRLLYLKYEFVRGHRVGEYYADMRMQDDRYVWDFEIDCGTMKRKRVESRWRKYCDCTHDVLIVAAPRKGNPEARLRQLMSWSQDIKDIAFFTTLERLKAHGPYARVWDYIGRGEGPLKRVKLPVDTVEHSHAEVTPQTPNA